MLHKHVKKIDPFVLPISANMDLPLYIIQAAMMHDLEVSRDKAIEKLKQTRGRVKQRSK